MIKIYLVVAFILLSISGNSQESIALWPEAKIPNAKGMALQRIDNNERITQVGTPCMYPFISSKEENTGAAVLIFPPGGYQKHAYNIAGFQLAKWFNTFGVNAFVVLYRLPTSPDLENPAYGPIMDAQRAMKYVRSHAKQWSIDPERIGVMGCSAGGGVTANMATFKKDYSNIGDSLDKVSFIPNFQILVSGTISMFQDAHKGSHDALLGENADEQSEKEFSGELNVHRQTPPAFITCASDDPVVNPMNSVRYYTALQYAGIDAALHIFTHGEHSIALRNNPLSTNLWTDLCETWLIELGYLNH